MGPECAKTGGVMMDMGCHAIAWFLWMLKGATVKNVYGNFLKVMHDTDAEDHAITQIEFERDGKTVLCVGEDSWAKHGGMQDMIEVYGDKGVAYSDLFQGNSSQMYSLEGYDYASEKAGATTGWTFPVFEEAFNQGYPQELTHFIDCVRNGTTPVSDGAGVKLNRLIATPTLDYLDPFLLLDHFGSDNKDDYIAGFPEHPHRGIETVTYMLKGKVTHRDTMGNEGTMSAGDIQWMTAGGGLMHEEMPVAEEEGLSGFQLWVI
mgnify:CR=1 FL=1